MAVDYRYRCTTCGAPGNLEDGETPDSIRPHATTNGTCHGSRVVEIGSQEEVDLCVRLRAEMYAELGIDPAKMKLIASAPLPPPVPLTGVAGEES